MSAQTVPAAPLYPDILSATVTLDGQTRSFLQVVVRDLIAMRNKLDALTTDYLAHTHKSAGATSQTSIAGTDTAGTTTTTPSVVTAPASVIATV